MLEGNGSMESRYKEWLRSFGEKGLDFCVMLEHIWDIVLNRQDSMSKEDFFFLICFVTRARQSQGNLIHQICRERRLREWDSRISRANCVYLRAVANAQSLQKKLSTRKQINRCAYLYVVTENLLLYCNKQEIIDLLHTEQEASLYRAGAIPSGRYFSLNELLYDMELKQKARQLSIWLLNNWKQRHLNVFCHYYESLAGLSSERLADESRDNRNQLHKRLRDKLKDLITNHNIDEDAMRIFCAYYLPKICQRVPVWRAYNQTEEKAP